MGESAISEVLQQCHMQQGKRLLSSNRPALARQRLTEAARQCRNRHELAELFCLLGIAARREGLPNYAIGCFVRSYAARKVRRMRRKIAAITNDYGMAERFDSSDNDWQAFYCIHLRRYLESKNSRRVGTKAESDMIRELIYEHWQQLRGSRLVAALDPNRRLLLYRKVVIIFPFFDVPNQIADPTVHVDFTKKDRLLPPDRCVCGSGLPYKVCCGRTVGEDELAIGEF